MRSNDAGGYNELADGLGMGDNGWESGDGYGGGPKDGWNQQVFSDIVNTTGDGPW